MLFVVRVPVRDQRQAGGDLQLDQLGASPAGVGLVLARRPQVLPAGRAALHQVLPGAVPLLNQVCIYT